MGRHMRINSGLLQSLLLTIGLGMVGAAAAQDVAAQNMATPQLMLSSPSIKDMEPLPLKCTKRERDPVSMMSPGMTNGTVSSNGMEQRSAWNECLRPDAD